MKKNSPHAGTPECVIGNLQTDTARRLKVSFSVDTWQLPLMWSILLGVRSWSWQIARRKKSLEEKSVWELLLGPLCTISLIRTKLEGGRWGNWGWRRFKKPKVTQVISGRTAGWWQLPLAAKPLCPAWTTQTMDIMWKLSPCVSHMPGNVLSPLYQLLV